MRYILDVAAAELVLAGVISVMPLYLASSSQARRCPLHPFSTKYILGGTACLCLISVAMSIVYSLLNGKIAGGLFQAIIMICLAIHHVRL